MRSHSVYFVAFIAAALPPVLSAPAPAKVNRDVQHNNFYHPGPPGPGMMETHPVDVAGHPDLGAPGSPEFDGGEDHMTIFPKRTLDLDTLDQLMKALDTANLPTNPSASTPTKTYSKRAMNLAGLSKAFGFFRDLMDEGVALDATSSDIRHLNAAN